MTFVCYQPATIPGANEAVGVKIDDFSVQQTSFSPTAVVLILSQLRHTRDPTVIAQA